MKGTALAPIFCEPNFSTARYVTASLIAGIIPTKINAVSDDYTWVNFAIILDV